MKTLVLETEKIYCGNLRLVNAHYPLKNNGEEELGAVDTRFPSVLMQCDAANALRRILEKISAEDAIVPVSGYRSLVEQTALYNDSFKTNGETFTRKYVAKQNHSEHQTGLAIDLGQKKENIDFIRPDFPYDGICGKFRRAAEDYGFIERYTAGKEKITGISQEPWHFRYVGYPHSKIMEEKGFSLEEYTEFLKSYREDGRLFYKQPHKEGAEIYYVPAGADKTQIAVPERCNCQVSGNNADGFIVTIWGKDNDKR